MDVAAAIACAAAAAITLANVHTPVRAGLVAATLVIGTGWAATCWMGLTDAAYAGTVALGAGISILFLYGLLFVEIGWWHPVASIGALLLGAAVVNASAVVRDALWRSAP
jgi:hypothetical protein